MVRDVNKFLQNKESSSTDPALAARWSRLGDYYSKRLWHQLTIETLQLIKHPSMKNEKEMFELYENFIQDFELRINPLSLMEMVVELVKFGSNTDEMLEFLNKSEPKVKDSLEATALCKLTKGEVVLMRRNDLQEAKKVLDDAEIVLNNINGVTPIHGRFYLLQSQLHKITGDTGSYYRSALKFLGCTDIKSLNFEEQRIHAKHLTVAALISEDTYNFGELLAHPILNSLKRTSDEWLVELLHSFNKGDITTYDSLRKKWSTNESLSKKEQFMREKITLLSLMEMTFQRPARQRLLTFSEIAERIQLPEDVVELCVMKAISKGLVKGAIDEVGRTVLMTWVQPRVLDRQQIGTMIVRLDTWKNDIVALESMMQNNAKDILQA